MERAIELCATPTTGDDLLIRGNFSAIGIVGEWWLTPRTQPQEEENTNPEVSHLR